MCFSAPVSFGASAVISFTGIKTVKSVKNKNEILFAIFPFIFAFQQFLEGIVWISFNHPLINSIAAYSFNFIALCIWPLIIPIAIFLLEDKKNKLRKTILLILSFTGVLYFLFNLYILFTYPLISDVYLGSIIYSILNYPVCLSTPSTILYLLIVLPALLASSIRFINVWGLFAIISFIIAFEFFSVVYISVWCFFGALLSIGILLYFNKRLTLKLNNFIKNLLSHLNKILHSFSR